jgi:hypothetical protein
VLSELPHLPTDSGQPGERSPTVNSAAASKQASAGNAALDRWAQRLPVRRGVASGASECLTRRQPPASKMCTGVRCLSMDQNSELAGSNSSSPHTDVLPANVDDPRFADHARSDRHAEWTTASALAATATEPVDEAGTFLTSPAGVLALMQFGVRVVLEALGSLLSTLLTRSGH